MLVDDAPVSASAECSAQNPRGSGYYAQGQQHHGRDPVKGSVG